MHADEKFELITRNLQEILGAEELKTLLQKKEINIYWGTATTGKPHIAYFLPLLKIRDFVLAGCKIKILLADIHAFLDNLKAPIELVNYRTEYYEKLIKSMLKSINVPIDSVDFIRGSSFQKSEKYVMDVYKLATMTSERDARKAGTQVVKQVDNPSLGSLIYPGMQALDEEYLNVDAQFGGVDQRKIFTFAMKYLPLLGYKKRIHLMNPMIDGLNSGKMSSSDVYSKIDMVETREEIEKKIKKGFCAEGDTNSGLFQLLKFVIYPIFKIRNLSVKFNEIVYDEFEALKSAFEAKNVHPGDFKKGLIELIDIIINPIREEMNSDLSLITNAYPVKKK